MMTGHTRDYEGRVGFAVGTGRCGTHFLAALMRAEPGVASAHERNRLNESFERYCRWYQLPVDQEGFLFAKEQEIGRDLARRQYSFEASAYLSLSLPALYQRFGARFVVLTREPARFVASCLSKGQDRNEILWYERPYVVRDPSLALGYQAASLPNHFFGRIAPTGERFWQWNALTRVGKLAWHWAALNSSISALLRQIPESHWRICQIETLDLPAYQALAAFLGVDSSLRAQDFSALLRRARGARARKPESPRWTQTEMDEFEQEAAGVAERLGYPLGAPG
jgi:hypothetical protein